MNFLNWLSKKGKNPSYGMGIAPGYQPINETKDSLIKIAKKDVVFKLKQPEKYKEYPYEFYLITGLLEVSRWYEKTIIAVPYNIKNKMQIMNSDGTIKKFKFESYIEVVMINDGSWEKIKRRDWANITQNNGSPYQS